MAVLIAADRAMVSAEVQRRVKSAFGGCLKADLRAAVDATDTWIDTNTAAYVAALPLPSRTALSANEKTLVFCYVALKRAGLL